MMSVATAVSPSSRRLAGPMSSAVTGPATSEDWVTQAEAARVIGCHVHTVKAVALAGGLRYRAIPGARITYSRADAEKLAAAG